MAGAAADPVAERRTGHTWRRIALELQRLHLVTLTGPAGALQQTTQPSSLQSEIYAATGVQAPPRITALRPV
jgi:hypothetical protein